MNLAESRRWCDCGAGLFDEWAFEGEPNFAVGFDGGENLGGFARAGNSSDTNKLTISSRFFSEIFEDFLENFSREQNAR